ncbi:MAG TPA: hypothetical protein VNN73_03360 [Blastocatellia bacterium]|nr:hypothetical protein [Blastocatellia bacterium]
MVIRKVIRASAWLFLSVACVALAGCASPPPQPVVEQPPAEDAQALQPLPERQAGPELPPPKLDEVQQAVARIFKGAVVLDKKHNPNFLVGDFNGDLSEDVAVIVKPAEGKLSELNQEFPNWIAREPYLEATTDEASKPLLNPASGQTVRFEQNDVLLAIIHGYGPQGWRTPEATQTHLLRGVVGESIRKLPLKEAKNVYKGKQPFPSIYGDLIQETLAGQTGFVHFAGAFYQWYDPKNFKPESLTGPAHPEMSRLR